jgi:hypothetical protein
MSVHLNHLIAIVHGIIDLMTLKKTSGEHEAKLHQYHKKGAKLHRAVVMWWAMTKSWQVNGCLFEP